MILEIIRNVLAFNLVLSDCLQAHSIFHQLKTPYFINAYTLWIFSLYTQATCTILFQTRANQLICSSVFSRLSLYGTKRNADTNTWNWETYLYHSFYKSLHLHLLPIHTRSKTSRARKMAVFRASSVLLLHDIPFQMEITTADELVFFVLPWINFVLPWVKFVVPWLFVLPWQLWATVDSPPFPLKVMWSSKVLHLPSPGVNDNWS